jgi:hypothetical protein
MTKRLEGLYTVEKKEEKIEGRPNSYTSIKLSAEVSKVI